MQSPALKLNKILLTVQDNRNECGSVLMFFGKKIFAAIIMTPILAAVTFLSPMVAFAQSASSTDEFATSTALLVGNQIVFGTVVTFFIALATCLWIYKTISG